MSAAESRPETPLPMGRRVKKGACGVVCAPKKTTTVPRIYLRWHQLDEANR